MLPCNILIASFSAFAKCCFDSRRLPRLPLAIGATHGALAVRQMLSSERAAVRTAALREMVPAKMAALWAQSTYTVATGLKAAGRAQAIGRVFSAKFVEESNGTAVRGVSQQVVPHTAIGVNKLAAQSNGPGI